MFLLAPRHADEGGLSTAIVRGFQDLGILDSVARRRDQADLPRIRRIGARPDLEDHAVIVRL
jgi:hypothetical protein